jgi:hypothetical protein
MESRRSRNINNSWAVKQPWFSHEFRESHFPTLGLSSLGCHRFNDHCVDPAGEDGDQSLLPSCMIQDIRDIGAVISLCRTKQFFIFSS